MLDAFIEDLLRDAQDRASLVEPIAREAIEATSQAGRPSCTVVVGESGTGKSVVFALTARRLQEADGVLLLKHSAGVSPLSLTVDSMLRRWCGALAVANGESNQGEHLPGGDELRGYFGSLLQRAAAQHRVVILIDALDQFARTPEAAYLTWLPDRAAWPNNVVLIATATPGTETGALRVRGAREITIPPLEREEAAAIAAQICAHYHKILPSAVTTALVEKRSSGGELASSNPLWLALAVNELLILDAEDFALLPSFSGTAEERLVRLLLHVVDSMPAAVDDAHQHVYARVEKTYGRELVSETLTLLSLPRFGLRESDVRSLIGNASGWSASSFAAIRRALRSHIGERGKGQAWAFLHQQGRRAALDRYAADPARRRIGTAGSPSI